MKKLVLLAFLVNMGLSQMAYTFSEKISNTSESLYVVFEETQRGRSDGRIDGDYFVSFKLCKGDRKNKSCKDLGSNPSFDSGKKYYLSDLLEIDFFNETQEVYLSHRWNGGRATVKAVTWGASIMGIGGATVGLLGGGLVGSLVVGVMGVSTGAVTGLAVGKLIDFIKRNSYEKNNVLQSLLEGSANIKKETVKEFSEKIAFELSMLGKALDCTLYN